MIKIDNELIELMKQAEKKGYLCYRSERVMQTQRLLPNAMDASLDTLADTPAYNPLTKKKYQGLWFMIKNGRKEVFACRLNNNTSTKLIKQALRSLK